MTTPDADRRPHSLCPRRIPAHEGAYFWNIRRQGSDGPQTGRIGFMSTQGREQNRRRRMKRTISAASPVGFYPSEGDFRPGPRERGVEESLRSDHRTVHFARSARQETRRGLPPPWAGPRRANHRSCHPVSPFPANSLRFRPSLPQIPACPSCRAERYDGKRDLYFQHAARNAACDS